MPIYEYQCQSCGYSFEIFQRMSESPLTECPQCHKSTLGKIMSPTSFQLKGEGWYKTDYSKKTSAVTPESKPDTTDSASTTTESAPKTSETKES